MPGYFDDVNESLFKLGDMATLQARDVTQAITDMSVSLTMGGSSEVTVNIVDPNFAFASANYFQVRRDLFYRDLWFEIAAVETSRSDAIHPLYTLQCRSKAVQLMKRDKKPEAYRGMSGYDFAQAMAKRFAMNFVGEKTSKKQSIVKGKSKNSDDSVWTVLTSLASEQQFVCFESANTLFFCSEKFLLGKWGDPQFCYGDFKFVPFIYPEPNAQLLPGAKDKYVLLDQPRVRRSDDDIKAAEGSMIVDRVNGIYLRPGMTIFLAGIPDFEGFYLITDVSFNEGSPEPVQVQFRVPVDPTKEKISTNGTKQTPSTAGKKEGSGTNKIAPAPGTKVEPDQKSGLSPAGARTYCRQALARLRARVKNRVIEDTVANAVQRLLNGTDGDLVIKQIQNLTNVSADEKRNMLIVLFWYCTKRPVSTLAGAGGVTTTMYNSRKAEFLKIFAKKKTNVTPTKTQTTSPATVPKSAAPTSVGQKVITTPTLNEQASGTSSTVITQKPSYKPDVSINVGIRARIFQAMAKSRPANINGPTYSKAQDDVISVAQKIYREMSVRKKIEIMNNWYYYWRAKADNYKYNGLRAVWDDLSGNAGTDISSIGRVPDAY